MSLNQAVPMSFMAHGNLLACELDQVSISTWLPANAEVFQGHYPHFPILPGVYLIELALQTLQQHAIHFQLGQAVIHTLHSVRLLAPVRPEDTLTCEAVKSTKQINFSSAFTINQAEQPLVEGNQNIDYVSDISTWDVNCFVGPVVAAKLRISVTLRPNLLNASTALTAIQPPALETGLLNEALESSNAPAGQLNAYQIRQILPHRFPILLVDQVTQLKAQQSSRASKAVTLNEPCYRDLPENASPNAYAYPQALLVESFLQSAGLFFVYSVDKARATADSVMLFGSLSKTYFYQQVYPGDVIEHEVYSDRLLTDSAILKGCSRVNGELVASFSQAVVALRPREVLENAA